MKMGPGCWCHPVTAPGRKSWRWTTMSVAPFVFALQWIDEWASGFTGYASYVPRARSVGVTPAPGFACVIAANVANAASITSKADSPARLVLVTVPPLLNATRLGGGRRRHYCASRRVRGEAAFRRA